YGGDLLVERYIPGRELTVAVLEGQAMAVTEIRPEVGFYDFRAKYSEGYARHVVPAELPDEITAICLDWAERAHAVLGCRGVSRADFRYDESQGADGIYLLEVNTQPGMTPMSLVPEQAAHRGIAFDDLVVRLVEIA
ncbi:MAG: D-alanine--D-alanine ligase, partial [Geminicoccaceae bacterium]